MRRALALALAPLALATTIAQGARAEVPAYSALPSGHATAPPQGKRPAAIGANERVPGFFLAQPFMHPNVPKSARHLVVVGSAKQAEEVRTNGGLSGEASSVCFSQSRDLRFSEGPEDMPDDGRAFDWVEGLSGQAVVFPKSDHNPAAGVTAVHAEKLVEDAAGARIESIDAWVDPVSRGVRKITAATLPLRLVRTAMGGLKVYAARDERKDVKLVQVVIVQAKNPEVPQMSSMMAMHQNGSTSHSNGCSHLRVAIPVDGSGGGEGATVTTTLELPGRGAKDEVRLREARVQLSVSKTSRDVEPVVSVSFGWGGRETTQRTGSDRMDE